MSQKQRRDRRAMQVTAIVCREVAVELRETAKVQEPSVRAGLEYVAEVQEYTADRLESEAGGPLPGHRPASETERVETHQRVYAAMNSALRSSGAPPELLKQWGAQ